jgi:hypothetical protein
MSSPCPSVLDLGSSDPAVRDHIDHCGRCQALLGRLKANGHIDSGPEPSSTLLSGAADSIIAELGTVWALSAPSADTFMFVAVLAADDTEAWVAPGADELDPIDSDFRIPDDRLGFELWIRAAHSFKVLREQLQDEIGRLTGEEIGTVLACVQTVLDGTEFVGDERFGVPVVAKRDPRLASACHWAEDTRRWREPWTLLAVADELGAVCAARREVLGMSVSDLAQSIDVEAEDWARFEAATLDIHVKLPTSRLADGVRKLSLPISKKLLALAATSVSRTHRPDPGTQNLALARRRQGRHRAVGRPDPDAVQAAAERYAAALGERLGI